MSISLIIVILALGSVVCFVKHIQHYKALVLSLKNRSLDVANYKVGFHNYGSGGCIRKLNDLSFQFESQLTENERGLIVKCKRAYNYQAIGLAAFVLFVLITLFGGSFG